MSSLEFCSHSTNVIGCTPPPPPKKKKKKNTKKYIYIYQSQLSIQDACRCKASYSLFVATVIGFISDCLQCFICTDKYSFNFDIFMKGADGVEHVLRILRHELDSTMGLCGNYYVWTTFLHYSLASYRLFKPSMWDIVATIPKFVLTLHVLILSIVHPSLLWFAPTMPTVYISAIRW